MSFFRNICVYFRLFWDSVIDFIFSLYWEKKKEIIPDLSEEHVILANSAVTLAKKIKNKELKSEDLVKAVIERIQLVNPILNAVTAERYDAALEEAREVDRQISAGLSEEMASKPFLGKIIHVYFMTGAIKKQETRNPVYGMTKNPQHTGRSPGGSSGAEAALTASYATPISLCSDIGGSTRMPAMYCGIFGHHPTAGVTSSKGIFFRKVHPEDTMFCLGFVSKHAEDLAPLTKVIAGDRAHELKLDADVDVKKLKFYYLESSNDCLMSPLRPEMKDLMNRVIKNVKDKLNVEVHPYRHEGFNHMYRLWSYWMSKEPENYFTLATNSDKEPNGFIELAKKMIGMSKYCLFLIIRFIELRYLPLPNSKWAEEITKSLKDDLAQKLGDNGVLLLPSSPQATPYHYSCFLRPFNFGYFGIVNALKCPATQVPLGTNSGGLPIGLQVLSTRYNDALCLAVAQYLEKEFGGAVMACNCK
ncbi:fatty-acid amide hydrolase 2-like [Zerene cesonia]|uniref:fatty-acid amide hydrolase 2-like n=1 Tax=Zerene cesonia TaxID=33412 RepID=UPI0018E559E2|nr:fatty-acid amide hydrolase 2-like [Zerene cesonia]